MKIDCYEEDDYEEPNGIIKLWLFPETPQETRLLDRLKKKIKNFNPIMLYNIANWFEEVKSKKPKLLLKFPRGWEK